MKNYKIYRQLIVSFLFLPFVFSLSAQAKSYHVILQGFHWSSYQVPSGWYNIIHQNNQRIANSGFTMVWFPPPSKSTGFRPQGYEPTELYNLNSAYGTHQELVNTISGLHSQNIQVMADIVINHRSGSTDWADFKNPEWSTSVIAADDEWWGVKSSNKDTGQGIDASRDLDHMNPEVQQGVGTWLSYLRTQIGFDAWRYDMAKGFAGWAISLYNSISKPTLSVGEYLSGDIQENINWIDSTSTVPNYRSSAFDYPLRFRLYDAVVWGRYGDLHYNNRLTGLIGYWADKSVTFLENHDTEEARGGIYMASFPNGKAMLEGYAFILTHPGTPTVFWTDIFDSGEYTEKILREMIWIRRQYAIHSESPILVDKATNSDGYAAYISGDKGSIAVHIGPGNWQPQAKFNTVILQGPSFTIWDVRNEP
ncbi:MAG: hypothetical protein KDD61_14960 [Bdellovibrionales bacterium]|nr:hypothetical protein [Bdellovibrionales bacterium]